MTGLFKKKAILTALSIFLIGVSCMLAQPTPPPPQFPGGPMQQVPGTPPPDPGPAAPVPQQPMGAPPVQTPPPPMPNTPPGWGAPGYLSNPALTPDFNQGTLNVMATGYDTESVLVQIPLVVSYSFNGATYNVTVLNSWNPYTQTWNIGVDTPAFSTDYYFNGFNYNYTVSLPSGTFYFNL